MASRLHGELIFNLKRYDIARGQMALTALDSVEPGWQDRILRSWAPRFRRSVSHEISP